MGKRPAKTDRSAVFPEALIEEEGDIERKLGFCMGTFRRLPHPILDTGQRLQHVLAEYTSQVRQGALTPPRFTELPEAEQLAIRARYDRDLIEIGSIEDQLRSLLIARPDLADDRTVSAIARLCVRLGEATTRARLRLEHEPRASMGKHREDSAPRPNSAKRLSAENPADLRTVADAWQKTDGIAKLSERHRRTLERLRTEGFSNGENSLRELLESCREAGLLPHQASKRGRPKKSRK